ncbi:hypothetical protein JMUB5695_00926 [Mycobacterium heckeshornense]|nr:hypothetical protein JMUB5695_00926 [Mycobacterium heckeshornense]
MAEGLETDEQQSAVAKYLPRAQFRESPIWDCIAAWVPIVT